MLFLTPLIVFLLSAAFVAGKYIIRVIKDWYAAYQEAQRAEAEAYQKAQKAEADAKANMLVKAAEIAKALAEATRVAAQAAANAAAEAIANATKAKLAKLDKLKKAICSCTYYQLEDVDRFVKLLNEIKQIIDKLPQKQLPEDGGLRLINIINDMEGNFKICLYFAVVMCLRKYNYHYYDFLFLNDIKKNIRILLSEYPRNRNKIITEPDLVNTRNSDDHHYLSLDDLIYLGEFLKRETCYDESFREDKLSHCGWFKYGSEYSRIIYGYLNYISNYNKNYPDSISNELLKNVEYPNVYLVDNVLKTFMDLVIYIIEPKQILTFTNELDTDGRHHCPETLDNPKRNKELDEQYAQTQQDVSNSNTHYHYYTKNYEPYSK